MAILPSAPQRESCHISGKIAALPAGARNDGQGRKTSLESQNITQFPGIAAAYGDLAFAGVFYAQ